jgi:hypothetical protein
MREKFFYFLFILVFGLFSCQNNRWEIPADQPTVKRDWKRFDLDLYGLSEKKLEASDWEQLEKSYPRFLPLYTQGVMRFGAVNSPEALGQLNDFTKDADIATLLNEVAQAYPDGSLQAEKSQLDQAFSSFAYFFPERRVPAVYTFVSALTYHTVVDDSLLGIGLDMYLGKDYPVYPQAGIPKYKFKHFEQDYLVADAMRAWLVSEFPLVGGGNLLEQMIYHGKIAYLLNAFLPELPEHLLLTYTQQEYDWCISNEADIWFHFVDMNLLHNRENHQLRKYLGEAPFIAGFPEGSPGRVGQWLGYQIVKDFMAQNPKMSLPDLMKLDQADLILQESNYKPKRS